MKDTFLCFLGILGSNYMFSQDVSPCYGLEMTIPVNGEQFFSLEMDLSSIDCETCEVDMSWQPGNVYGPTYLVFPSSTDMSFDVCCTVEISGDVNETCLICDEYTWMDTAWGPYMISDVPNYVLDDENDDYYYDLSGVRYNSYGEIPSGHMYIHNRKKYIKE